MTHPDERDEREDDGTASASEDERAATSAAASAEPAQTEAKAPAAAVRPAAPRPAWMRVAELVVPVAFAGAAMGVHWWVNVPDKIVQSPNDQGAKDKDKDKKAEKDKKKPDKARTAKRDESRTAEQLDADWEQWGTTPFDDEPTRTAWARRHQIVINRAVVEARRHAFAGAPEEPSVVLASTACRTVRCRFMLRASSTQELDLMTSALQRMQLAGEPLWRSFAVEPAPPEEQKEAKSLTQHAVRVTVAFRTDDTEVTDLEVPAAGPEAAAPENDAEPEQGGDPENEEPAAG